jgi:hypothetical protein
MPICRSPVQEEIMDNRPTPSPRSLDLGALKAWLASPVTVTLPGWALASGALVVLVLVLVALD